MRFRARNRGQSFQKPPSLRLRRIDAKQSAVSGNIAVAQLSLSAQSTAIPIRQRGPAQFLSHDNCVTVRLSQGFDVSNRSNSSDTSLSTAGCARIHCISRFLNALKQIASDALGLGSTLQFK